MRRLLPWLPAVVLGAVLLVLLGSTWAARWDHPFDLEWMEGGMLAHAWRLQRGLPLYPEPGPDWVPYIYPPGYPALLAVLAGEGLGYGVGRLVSLGGSLLAAASTAWLVFRHGVGPSRGLVALLSGVMLLGTWHAAGTFLDLVRPDALSLGLLLTSVALGLERRPAAQIAGGVLLALAFLVKHHVAAFGLPVALALWARDRQLAGALRYGLAAALPAGMATAALQVATGGTFLTYLLRVPASHGVVGLRMAPGTPWEVAGTLPLALVAMGAATLMMTGLSWGRRAGVAGVALGLALGLAPARASAGDALGPLDRALDSLLATLHLGLGPVPGVRPASGLLVVLGLWGLALVVVASAVLVWQPWTRQQSRRAVLPVLLVAVALLVASWMRGHVGGFVNVLLPAFAAVSVVGGVALTRIGSRGLAGAVVASTLLTVQLAVPAALTPWPSTVPTAQDVAAGERIVARLRELPGPVWSPISPWLAVQAGHAPGPPLIAVWDVANHPAGPWPATRARFIQAVRDGHWAIIVDGDRPLGFGVERHTRVLERLQLDRDVLLPKAGWPNRPATLRGGSGH